MCEPVIVLNGLNILREENQKGATIFFLSCAGRGTISDFNCTIEGIVTTNTRIRQLVEEKTTPKNRDEQEIAGYRDVLNIFE